MQKQLHDICRMCKRDSKHSLLFYRRTLTNQTVKRSITLSVQIQVDSHTYREVGWDGSTTKPFSWRRHSMQSFPHYLPIMRGIDQSPVDSSHKGPATWSLGVVSIYRLLNTQSICRWFETSWCSCGVTVIQQNNMMELFHARCLPCDQT